MEVQWRTPQPVAIQTSEPFERKKNLQLVFLFSGQSEFDLMKTNANDVNESPAFLSSKHGVLKEFLTRYENERLQIYSLANNTHRYLFEIDLNHVLAIHNQSVNAVSLKCRLTNSSMINVKSQCTFIVDERTSSNEYVWVFPNQLERSLWIRELLKRQYSFHQLIYPDFLLLTKMNIQEGINADKQQVIVIVYPGRFVICSDTMFDEIDLRKYSNLGKVARRDRFPTPV